MVSQKKWMVIRVKPRFEKRVEALLNELVLIDSAEAPKSASQILKATALTLTVERKWSDRIKKVEVPAINGYVFARFAEGLTTRQQLKALIKMHYTMGVLRIMTRDGLSSFDPEGTVTVTDDELTIFYEAAVESGGPLVPPEEAADTEDNGKKVRFREGPLAELGVYFRVDDMRKKMPTLYIASGVFMNASFTVAKEKLEQVKDSNNQ